MDFDTVEFGNLDRLIGATVADARLQRSKITVARRLMYAAATVDDPNFKYFDLSICEPEGLAAALDYDLIICCVDRPWARAVLNQIAYSDLIPVIDGGISIDIFPDGKGMRSATWRSHVIRPGRPCLVCNGQLDVSEVALDIQDLLDDRDYIEGAGRQRGEGQNVALLSISAAAAILAQFVSFNVAPGGLGDPGPLQHLLSTHTLEHLDLISRPGCSYETSEAIGDGRQALTGEHVAAVTHRRRRAAGTRWLDRRLDHLASWVRVHVDRHRARTADRQGT